MLVTPSLSHCSNKYKLAREGEKDKGNFFFPFICKKKILFFFSVDLVLVLFIRLGVLQCVDIFCFLFGDFHIHTSGQALV